MTVQGFRLFALGYLFWRYQYLCLLLLYRPCATGGVGPTLPFLRSLAAPGRDGAADAPAVWAGRDLVAVIAAEGLGLWRRCPRWNCCYKRYPLLGRGGKKPDMRRAAPACGE